MCENVVVTCKATKHKYVQYNSQSLTHLKSQAITYTNLHHAHTIHKFNHRSGSLPTIKTRTFRLTEIMNRQLTTTPHTVTH